MTGIASPEGRIGALNDDDRRLLDADGGVDGFISPNFELNTQVKGVDGFMYRYVQAGAAIPASNADGSVDAAGQLTDGAGTYVNTAAFLDNEYGWVRNAVITADAT
jgi:hypothetical protein